MKNKLLLAISNYVFLHFSFFHLVFFVFLSILSDFSALINEMIYFIIIKTIETE